MCLYTARLHLSYEPHDFFLFLLYLNPCVVCVACGLFSPTRLVSILSDIHIQKSYKRAAEEYEKAGAFAKCLSACADGNLFEMGIRLIGQWGGCGGAEQEFFKKGAVYYFGVKDLKSMMAFVSSFHSKDEMREFLTKKRCFDELISLEVEWGNFQEAAKVARLKPDPVFEADLLYMGGLHRQSSLTILWHVFLNSPLFQNVDEPFTPKDELLKKAVSIAKSSSDDFCQFVMKEARILSEGKSEEELLKKGHEFIDCYKNNELAMSLEQVKTNHEIQKIEKHVLHKCALYSLGVEDFKGMMKFVRSFHSKDEMRRFLTKKRCFDELISLEIEWGNFKEAAKVSWLKIDPAADLPHRLDRESSLLILWHVLLNSLVLQSTDEPFSQKDELLSKAVAIAESCSNFFYQFVSKEASILSEGKNQEELLIKGLEFIDCYKANSLAVSMKQVKTTQEIEKIENDVIQLMHSFFKSVNRVNEFLRLLEIRGKFVEAAKIGNEDDQSIKAALSILWYVFFGSLWACGKRAWPLKDFKQKNRLLDNANLYLESDHDSQDSALARAEINILSSPEISLCEMWKYLSETPKERSLRIHFLVSRRILDVYLGSDCSVNASIEMWDDDDKIKHLESQLSKNIISMEGLIYFWSYWKELMIRELIDWSSRRGHSRKDSKIYEDFICNYFGMRKYEGDKKGSYVVLNAEAHWVKEMNPRNMHTNGYLHIIHAGNFSSVASRYLSSELLFVAQKVLRKLQSLHAYATVKNVSMHQRVKILTNLFKVTESLQKCKVLNDWRNTRVRVGRIVDQFVQFSMDEFMSNVFHINWKNAQSKEMISLRGNETFLSMLKEAININSKSREGLTCWQLGRIAMAFLAYRMVDFNGDTMRKVKHFSSMNWKALFDMVNADKSSSKNVDLAISLHNVLKETMLSAGWLRTDDCMSPACFLYLVERLLILSFCFRDYVYMTRSSCVEWLTYEEWGMGSNGGSVTCSDIMKDIHQSLASMVSGILNSQNDLLEWVTRSKEESYDILVLRLTVLLSMICVNTGQHFCDHLLDVLGCPHLASVLPSTFAEGLIKGIKEDYLFDALVVACEKIDNPLVTVSFTKDSSKVPRGNAIFLNMVELDISRETLIEMLYQSPEFPLLSN
ncbi:hypothetical protein L2E82_44700 [Cichorium intybus]|uniref:Uncharacterized protein n=1 Tax=Cichorium intybus TaxID=13427 RepID=A0ACB8ZQV0_CICIN|nr:hypothetical protein L2E82_44700 [Cichorium intybus]